MECVDHHVRGGEQEDRLADLLLVAVEGVAGAGHEVHQALALVGGQAHQVEDDGLARAQVVEDGEGLIEAAGLDHHDLGRGRRRQADDVATLRRSGGNRGVGRGLTEGVRTGLGLSLGRGLLLLFVLLDVVPVVLQPDEVLNLAPDLRAHESPPLRLLASK
ncbi:hypothetical protein D3C78_1477320 [compost metagenome]